MHNPIDKTVSSRPTPHPKFPPHYFPIHPPRSSTFKKIFSPTILTHVLFCRLYRDVRAYAIPGGSEEIMLDLSIRQSLRVNKVLGMKL